MNLKDYLKTRGVLANALFKKEAAILNLPWPLPKGWVSIYGDIEISKEVEDRLRNFLGKKGRSCQDVFQQQDKTNYLALLKQLEATHQSRVQQQSQTARTESLVSDFAQQLAKNIQGELEERIRAELMKHAIEIVDQTAREIAKNIKSNLVGRRQFDRFDNERIILHVNIDGVEKGKF